MLTWALLVIMLIISSWVFKHRKPITLEQRSKAMLRSEGNNKEDEAMDVDAGVEASESSPASPSFQSPTSKFDRARKQGDSARPFNLGPILFYHRSQPYYEFTNFSPHAVVFDGHTYPTAEHLFQAHKFIEINPQLAEHIRELPSPRAALQEATRHSHFRRADWFQVNIGVMDSVLEAKFTQHPDLCCMLLDTGDRTLIEDSPVDAFWGTGENGKGRNELGRSLMRLREKLKQRSC